MRRNLCFLRGLFGSRNLRSLPSGSRTSFLSGVSCRLFSLPCRSRILSPSGITCLLHRISLSGTRLPSAKFAPPGKISMEFLEFALLAIEVKVRPLSFPPSSGPFDLFASRPPRPFFWTRGNTWEFTLKEPNWPAPVDLARRVPRFGKMA